MPLEIGTTAPDFTLKDYNNEDVTLSSFRGSKAVLLVFYPLAFTGICTGELCAVRDDLDAFQNDDVQILALSVDSTYALKIFSDRESYRFPILSDFWPHGAVASLFGVFNEVTGFANRGTFLINSDGVITFAEMNEPGQGRQSEDWIEAIKRLTPSAVAAS
jgi:peroxiredoxin